MQFNRNVSGIMISIIQDEQQGTGCKVIYERLTYVFVIITVCTEYLVCIGNRAYKLFVLVFATSKKICYRLQYSLRCHYRNTK